jgi:hypothetical protein
VEFLCSFIANDELSYKLVGHVKRTRIFKRGYLAATIAAIIALVAVVAVAVEALTNAVADPWREVFYAAVLAVVAGVVIEELYRRLMPQPQTMRATQPIEPLSVHVKLVAPDGHEFKITKNTRTFGRADFTGLCADDCLFVGRQHFRVMRKSEAWYVEDSDTRNGTLLNDMEIKGAGPQRLSDGDEITVAKIMKLTFYAEMVN